MIPNYITSDSILLTDECLINGLKSEDHDTLQSSQIIIDYLSYKKENKSAIMIPTIYRSILKKAEDVGDEELIRYLESLFCEAKIGCSTENPNSREYRTVLEYLSLVHKTLIFFITEDQACIDVAKKINSDILTGDVKKTAQWIQQHDPPFADNIFSQYFDSPA